MIEQVKFTYSPLRRSSEKQAKTIKKERDKKLKAVEKQKQKQIIANYENVETFLKKRIIFENLNNQQHSENKIW